MYVCIGQMGQCDTERLQGSCRSTLILNNYIVLNIWISIYWLDSMGRITLNISKCDNITKYLLQILENKDYFDKFYYIFYLRMSTMFIVYFLDYTKDIIITIFWSIYGIKLHLKNICLQSNTSCR